MREWLLPVGDATDAEACGDLDRLLPVDEAELFQAGAHVLGYVVGRVDAAVRHEDGEAVARNPRGLHARREIAANDLRDAHDDLVTDVHAEILVQHVQAIEIDVDHAIVARERLRRQHRLHALLERRAGQQPGRRVVGVQQDVGDAAREQLDDPHLAQVEVGRFFGLEEHQDAEHALRALHHRAGKRLERHPGHRAAGERAIGRQRLPVQLRPADQVPVTPREEVGASPRWRAVARTADGDVLVGDQQRADAAAEMIDAALHEFREVVGRFSPGRLVVRATEQQLEVAVTHDQVPLQVTDAGLRNELALEALERRTQQAPDQVEWPQSVSLRRFPADQPDAAEQGAGRIAQEEDVGHLLAPRLFGEPLLAARLGKLEGERLLHELVQRGVVEAFAHPHGDAHPIVDDDRLRTRQQHLYELAVGVERGGAERGRGFVQRRCVLHGAHIHPIWT